MADVTDADAVAEFDGDLPAEHAELFADLRTVFRREPSPSVAEKHLCKIMEATPPPRVIPRRERSRSRKRVTAVACAVVATVSIGGAWAAADGRLPDRLQSIASAVVEPFGIDWPDGAPTADVDEPDARREPAAGQDEQDLSEPAGPTAEPSSPEGADPSDGSPDTPGAPGDPGAGEQGQSDPSGPSAAAPPGQSGQPGQAGQPHGGRPEVPPGLGDESGNPGERPDTPPGQSEGFTPPGQQHAPPGQTR